MYESNRDASKTKHLVKSLQGQVDAYYKGLLAQVLKLTPEEFFTYAKLTVTDTTVVCDEDLTKYPSSNPVLYKALTTWNSLVRVERKLDEIEDAILQLHS